MNTRPILNQIAVVGQPTDAVTRSVPDGEARLASHLPVWDLVPKHNLLVRRRSGQVSKVAAPPDTVVKPAAASPAAIHTPAPAPAARPASDASTSPAICRQCSQPLEDDGAFCSECGAQQ